MECGRQAQEELGKRGSRIGRAEWLLGPGTRTWCSNKCPAWPGGGRRISAEFREARNAGTDHAKASRDFLRPSG